MILVWADKIITDVIAPGPAIRGIPIGDKAISVFDSASSDSLVLILFLKLLLQAY